MTAARGSPPSEPTSVPSSMDLLPGPQTPLLELNCPPAYAPRGGIVPLVRRILCAVWTALRHSQPRDPAPDLCRVPLRPWTCSLLQSLTGPDCRRTSQQQLSWGSRPFSDISSGGPVTSGLPRPTPSDFRVSHPLVGLRPPEPSGLVSCRYRSWGSPSGLFPLTEP
jgi:hypothetical protein